MVVARRWLICAALALAAVALRTEPALASGPGETAPWYVDEFGGDPPDLAAYYGGRLGIVTPTAPRPMLYISWRLLHGQAVGQAAGEALSTPCCGTPWWAQDYNAGSSGWVEARRAIAGAPDVGFISTDAQGPNNTYMPNCFDDAFDAATAALKDRVARYGADSAGVKAWLATQDAVFAACSDASVTLPPLQADAPDWLKADRAYQEAALALYEGRNVDAAARFEAIGQDAASPWRLSGPYLTARAWVRQALADKSPASYAKAQAAVAALAHAPPGALGQGQAQALSNVLAYHGQPAAYLAKLQGALGQAEPYPQIAVDFRDFAGLGDAAPVRPDMLDWAATMRATPAPAPDAGDSGAGEDGPHALARYEAARVPALAHAASRWRASHDVAWLVAALGLADASDADAPSLEADAGKVSSTDKAWIDLNYQLIRLTLASAPQSETRARLDALLARSDLSVSDRNAFTALRTQVAASLDDFIQHSTRRRLCFSTDSDLGGDATKAPACARWRWQTDDYQRPGIYDGVAADGVTGFGEDALAIIDRAPLASRIVISQDQRLPASLRLDVALTSYGRAVQLQDNAAIDTLANELESLLPLMKTDFAGVVAARPGADKRFAEFFVLAKIPGVRTDIVSYTRPEGAHVEDFQTYWTDWVILARPEPKTVPPPLASYQDDGTGFEDFTATPWPDAATDLTCLGECGRGATPLGLPSFVAAEAAKAAAERAWFFSTDHGDNDPEPPMPTGAIDAWDEMLSYAAAHPSDPRIPEALHWLVHVGHFGGSHNHSGKRAFLLLHQRYGSTSWAKQTPYYYD